jgi:hypothetical protein
MKYRSPLPAVALALLLVAGSRAALADDPAPAPDPAAQAKSQALIDRTPSGASVFRVDLDYGTVIHIQSGMMCPRGQPAMALDRLVIEPGVALGDDVACNYVGPSGKTTVFATRHGSQTLEAYAADTFAAIRRIHPDARPIGGQESLLSPQISPPIKESFAIAQNGSAFITSAWIAQEGNWLILVRATYPAEQRHDLEFIAAALMMIAQGTIHQSAAK